MPKHPEDNRAGQFDIVSKFLSVLLKQTVYVLSKVRKRDDGLDDRYGEVMNN